MSNQHRITQLEHLLSALNTGRLVAITAPLLLDDVAIIGYAVSPEDSYCVKIPLDEFPSISTSLYFRITSPRAFHGLKRIWEYLDQRGMDSEGEIDKYATLHNIIDTKLLAYLLNPDSARSYDADEGQLRGGGLTLDHLYARYLGEDYPYRNVVIHAGGDARVFGGILAHDASLIYCLANDLPQRMGKGLHRLYRHLELPFMVVLNRMRCVGIGVDGAACAYEEQRVAREMASLAHEITGGEEVDLRSDRDVFLFLVRHGVTFRDPAAHQWLRVTKAAMEEVASVYPLVQKILDFRAMGTDLGFLRYAAGRDRVHPVWGQTGSATSRIYAREPAVQNVSRRLRHLFVPAAGCVLIKADYSQAQMRILAHLSGDEGLIEVFNDPAGDVHEQTSDLLGLHDREVAKEINFAICFGMGSASLCGKINDVKRGQGKSDFIDEATSQGYIDGFYGRYPRVQEFFAHEWAKIKKMPMSERVVRSLLGRERRFDRRATREVERAFRVTWPQQIEADMIKTAMVRLDRIFRRRGMAARIFMMIHDSLWVEAPVNEQDEVRHLMSRMMTTAAKLRVPLVADFSD